MHWADVMAERLSRRGDKHIIASGITPSGEFHIGHLREILTADMITRACRARGLDAEFIFIIDSADPLRKVYDFLDPEYERYIGHQLGAIPAPDADGKPGDGSTTYAAHFLDPFMAALKQIGVEPTIVDNLESYRDGGFAHAARIACENMEEVRGIIETRSGRELPEGWFPYNPLDSQGCLDGVTVTGYEWPFVHWADSHGETGSADLRKADGKLPWRLDWPARWHSLGVTCEPFGKDHGASGGSYSTGRLLVELFGGKPPEPLVYEWIMLRGVGAMSASQGITIGPLVALELVPPEILRFLIARNKPNKHIEFDTGSALVELAEEYRNLLSNIQAMVKEVDDDSSKRTSTALITKKAALLYSQVKADTEVNYDSRKVSFRHLAMLAQIRSEDEDVWASLERGALIESAEEAGEELEDRLRRMRFWLASEHFPEPFRLRVQSEITTGAIEYLAAEEHLDYLRALEAAIRKCEWESKTINDAICDTARGEAIDMNLRDAFKLLYWAFLDQDFGPRLAPLFNELGPEQVLAQLERAVNHLSE
jgi:lysyl-tRNA synthetase class 1